jgi:hypothetical protein
MTADHPRIPLQNFFSGVAEYAFETRLGVADPPLIDYLAELLTRFIRSDALYAVRSLAGRRLSEVAEMLIEAEVRVGEARREVHRHIGDFTLFWTGVYPEALMRLQAADRKDRFIDYSAQGKRAYYIASKIPAAEGKAPNAVLERLSHDFDICVRGLSEARREWERREGGDALRLVFVK